MEILWCFRTSDGTVSSGRFLGACSFTDEPNNVEDQVEQLGLVPENAVGALLEVPRTQEYLQGTLAY